MVSLFFNKYQSFHIAHEHGFWQDLPIGIKIFVLVTLTIFGIGHYQGHLCYTNTSCYPVTLTFELTYFLLTFFEYWMLELWYFTGVFLETRPLLWVPTFLTSWPWPWPTFCELNFAIYLWTLSSIWYFARIYHIPSDKTLLWVWKF